MNDTKLSIRERLAAMPRGAKVAGGLTAAAAVVAATAAIFWPRSRRHHRGPGGTAAEGAPPPPPDAVVSAPNPAAIVATGRGGMDGRHPLRALLFPRLPPGPRRPENDPAVRRDIRRLLEDIARAKRGEPPLAGAGANGGEDTPKALARLSFELGAYVAEALMARGIVMQMPDVPTPSAIAPGMTEKDGDAAFRALMRAADEPLDEGISALRDLRASSGITFWAAPGTDARVEAEIAEIRARRNGKVS